MTERKPRPTLKLAIPRGDVAPPDAPRARVSPSAERVLAEPPAAELTGADIALVKSLLIHEDEHVLAFNKPVGMSVQGGSGIDKSLDDLIAAFSKSNGKKPKLVHRLDRDTSGVIVVARSQPAAAALSKAFAGREANKTYIAVVCGGAPKPEAATISIPLKKMARNGIDMVRAARDGDNGVLTAKTRYRTLSKTKDVALVALQPETGRLHQLRAHMSMIDNPIAGDGKYGGLFAIGAVEISTMLLHAFSLSLPHPAGGILNISTLPPKEFGKTANALGLDISAPLAALAGAR